jgi:hypothetical protein
VKENRISHNNGIEVLCLPSSSSPLSLNTLAVHGSVMNLGQTYIYTDIPLHLYYTTKPLIAPFIIKTELKLSSSLGSKASFSGRYSPDRDFFKLPKIAG